MADTAAVARAELLRSFHIPGDPLIVTNVWDAATARAVAGVAGVRALATASHSISEARGVADGEGLSIDEALDAAAVIVGSVNLPVSVDFERGYARDAVGVAASIRRLIDVGAAGLNLEDSLDDSTMRPLADQVQRVEAVRATAREAGIPIVLNARVDSLRRGESFAQAVERANAYLEAGGDAAFVLGLDTAELVADAVAQIHGPVSVIARAGYLPLWQLAELGVARVSFGPGTQALTLTHLATAVAAVTARGDYPPELTF